MCGAQKLIRIIALVAALAGLGLAAPTHADNRIALVIGNASYQNAPPLPNPQNDATDVAAALGDLGFKTRLIIDGTKRQMDIAIAQFARDAKGADASLFYFAGHGMQFGGRNYVVPVDAVLQDEISVNYELMSIDELKGALENSHGVKIVVLNSCRDNPLADKLARSMSRTQRDIPIMRGFAPSERTNGMIVAYATQADQTARDGSGRNSPFSAAFLKELQTPRLEVGTFFRRVQEDVYKVTGGDQSPELSISLVPEYYLNLNETDRTTWERIRDKADEAALRDFLARYPDSFFASDARARLELLKQPPTDVNADALKKAADDAKSEAERLKREQAASDAALAEIKTRMQELEAQLVREKADKTKADQDAKAQQDAMKALKDKVADLQKQADTARSDAEDAAKRAAEAAKKAQDAALPTPPAAPSATLTPNPPTPDAAVVDLGAVRAELRRLDCFKGGDSEWRAPDLQAGLALYARYANLAATPSEPTPTLLLDLKQRKSGLCLPSCTPTQTRVGGVCVTKTCGEHEILSKTGACVAKPPRPIASKHPSTAPVSGGHCFVFNGSQFCE